jgi:branched-chain amino acid transport system permease protein
VVEAVALRTLYRRDHLDQVLATFGLILFFNELIRILFGPVPIFLNPPAALAGTVNLWGLTYPAFRLAILGTGLVVAVGLWLLIARTRVGMLIRAGATNREMVMALGVDVRLLFGLVFALGCGLAGLAGAMAGPVLAVQVGMGEQILILTFVVIVIGGIGSIRGAFAGALLVGVVDTLGRALLPASFRLVMDAASANAAGAAAASMAIYILMALVLAVRPKGLFPVG